MPDRLQREIDELLAKLDTFPRRRSPWARARDAIAGAFKGTARSLAALRLPRVSLGHLLLLGIAVIVIAYILRDSIGDPSLVRAVIAAGVVLFLAAFILSLRRSAYGGRPQEKRWRGEPMELGEPGRLRSWWGRWRGRR